ncbi:MAG: energy transducer TonB [Planctomycetota bacterium]
MLTRENSGATSTQSRGGTLLHAFLVVTGAAFLTVLFFLVLPLIQAIGKEPPRRAVQVETLAAEVDPPEVQEEEEEPEEHEEEEPPDIEQESQPLDLAELELALGGGFGGGSGFADFGIELDLLGGGVGGDGGEFDMDDLDQRPRPVFRSPPSVSPQMAQKCPGQVTMIAAVDERGRVVEPKVKESSHPVFDRAAINAFKKWRYEPGRRNGKPVRSKIRQVMTFPRH